MFDKNIRYYCFHSIALPTYQFHFLDWRTLSISTLFRILLLKKKKFYFRFVLLIKLLVYLKKEKKNLCQISHVSQTSVPFGVCFSVLFFCLFSFICFKRTNYLILLTVKLHSKGNQKCFLKTLTRLLLNFYGTSIFITKKWVPALFKCG